MSISIPRITVISTILLISLIFVIILGTEKAGPGKAEAETTTTVTAIADMDYKTYDVDALVAAEIGKILAYVEQTKIQEQQTATKASASITTIPPNYDPGDGSRWDQLAQCESGGNWAYPTVAGGFSGGLMFHEGTWNANGGQEYAPYAYMATREQQIEIAEKVLAGSGWRAWPGCSRKFGWL